MWSRAGRELFYQAGQSFWAVPVETEGNFGHETTELPIRKASFFQSAGLTYDVSPNSEHFLMVKLSATTEEGSQSDVVIVENWFEELKRLVPTD